MNMTELGEHIRQRRETLGLSQDRLAKLAGLSRVTINQLEAGSLRDLGVAKLITLLDVLGLTLDAGVKHGLRNGLRMASQTASVSYKNVITPAALARALVNGELPPDLIPHVATLLDEAPLSLIVAAIEEAARHKHVPPKQIWRHLIQWARQLQSPRAAWS